MVSNPIDVIKQPYILDFLGLPELSCFQESAIRVYRDKDAVEKCFDDLKNSLDMKRLRMHKSTTADGRLFIQFITLILISELRQRMRTSGLIEKYTVRELLREMETLTKVTYTGKYRHILTELTKAQRDILKELNIELLDMASS